MYKKTQQKKEESIKPVKRKFDNSDELCKYMVDNYGDTVILSFSMGKDSLGAYIKLKEYFKVIKFVYFYLVPGLQFVEKSLDYYEQLFGEHIYRMPNPAFYDAIRTGMYQSYDRKEAYKTLKVPKFTRDDVFNFVKEDYLNNNQDIFVATGVRAADNATRQTTVKVYGSVNYNRKQFFPIFDWKQDKLISELERAKIKLPNDYNIWGCSFDGLDYKFLPGVKQYYPEDFELIKEWFPLIEAELYRYEFRGKHGIQKQQH